MGFAQNLDLNGKLARVQHYFADEIWETRLDRLPKWEAAKVRALRILYSTLHGLIIGDALHVRAASLTYFTVLSIVPLLAFVFSMLKGFGAYDTLVEGTLRPYLLETFAGNPSLQTALEQILIFVGDTNVTQLGFLGLLALLYAAISLLRNIEIALNETWGVSKARSVLRQVTDYVAIIMVTPICLLLAAGLGTVTQLLGTLRSLQAWLGLGGLLEWSIGIIGPLFVITLGLCFLYLVMPNTSVRLRSAAVGGIVGGVLWYGLLIAHVSFQLGVARFNALYAGFGVIPIFLVWLYVSWLAVMVGGQAAAMHQQDRTRTRQAREASKNHKLTETLGLSAVLRIARAFTTSEPPPTLQELSAALDTSEVLLCELLTRVENAGLLIKAQDAGDTRFVLVRMPDQILVKHVLDALRRGEGEPETRRAELAGSDAVVEQVLSALDHELERSPHNLSLLELLTRA